MMISAVRSKGALIIEARRTLALNRDEFGALFGASKRTVARWEAGESSVSGEVLFPLARQVYPRSANLAEEIALAGGATLEKLGVVVPPPAPPVAPPLPAHVLVDAIVCAAADALKAVPETVRASVLASFRRARELRMTVEEVEKALAKR
jgi:hypothetical protein